MDDPGDHGEPLRLRQVDANTILRLARAGAPREVCGLLVGRGRTVERLVETPNAAERDCEYAIPPEAHFAALRAARGDGLAIIGAYHSHPASAARPSARDAATAFEHFVFLIAGLGPATGPDDAALRAWVYRDGNFTEVAIVRP